MAQTETMAHPGECRHFGHATKLHSFKSHNTHEDRGFGGPIPVIVGTFETTVTTLTRILGVYHVGGGRVGRLLTRNTAPYISQSTLAVFAGSRLEVSLLPPACGTVCQEPLADNHGFGFALIET